MARTKAVLCVGVLMLGTQIAAAEPQAGRGAQRGAPPRPAAAAPQPAATPPQVTAIAIRVVGPGLGANGSELQPFHESPGTAVALADPGRPRQRHRRDRQPRRQARRVYGRQGTEPARGRTRRSVPQGGGRRIRGDGRSRSARPPVGGSGVGDGAGHARDDGRRRIEAGARHQRQAANGLRVQGRHGGDDDRRGQGRRGLDEDHVRVDAHGAQHDPGSALLRRQERADRSAADRLRLHEREGQPGLRREDQGQDRHDRVRALAEPARDQGAVQRTGRTRPRGGRRAFVRIERCRRPRGRARRRSRRPPGPPPVIAASDGAASVGAVVKQMQSAAPPGKGHRSSR